VLGQALGERDIARMDSAILLRRRGVGVGLHEDNQTRDGWVALSPGQRPGLRDSAVGLNQRTALSYAGLIVFPSGLALCPAGLLST
jgi:hypothetical protein